MGPNKLTKKVRVPDKFDGVDINSAKKYGEIPIRIRSVNDHLLLTECITAHKMYQRITTAAVRQPHQKITIRDSTPIFKNSDRESSNLIRESRITNRHFEPRVISSH